MAGTRLKVMHIITRMVRGGAQMVLVELLKGLDRNHFDLTLVAGEQTGTEGSLWQQTNELGIRTVVLPQMVREVSPVQDLRALSHLRKVIARYAPDVVHCHTSKAGFLGCAAARWQGVPAIVLSPHGHILGAGARIPGVPPRGLKRRLLAAVARQSARLAHLVVAPNEVERVDGIRHGVWSKEKSSTIPNGVDVERFIPRERMDVRRELGWTPNAFTVGVVARLTEEKGVDLAISCLPSLPGVHLVVVGNGPETERLRSLAQELDVAERVSFHGLAERVEEILPAFDTLVIPSRTEAHGMVAAEALACQVPVVSTAVGGLTSIVIHEKTGLLVPPEDPRRLADGLRRLFLDRSLMERLARDGRRHVLENFSLGSMIHRTSQLYQTLVESRPGSHTSARARAPSR